MADETTTRAATTGKLGESGDVRLDDYPLSRALHERRSRRFSTGMSIAQGPLSFTSSRDPKPLSEEEQAILAFAACGITGPALADWSYARGTGGTMMARTVGRTVSSPDAVHTAAVFVIDDEATWLLRRPQDLVPDALADVVELTRKRRYVEAWRALRIRVADHRAAPTTEPPVNLNPNRWSLYAEGTTYFLPVTSLTYSYINSLLELLAPGTGFFFLDDRRMFLPAGLQKFAASKGGHLDDDPRSGKTLPLSWGERVNAELLAVEQGMIMQNLGLACQALGLSGFPHYAFHDEAWFEALGFRMLEMPLSGFTRVPLPAALALKAKRQDTTTRFPIGLERGGEVLLSAYCPPYHASMEDAVRAVLEDKYGDGGIYGGGEHGLFDRDRDSGWRDSQQVGAEVPPIEDEAIAATIAACDYIWNRYGRFPATYPPFHTLMGFQAGHLDSDFYDTHYRSGSLTDRHRQHDDRWHPGT